MADYKKLSVFEQHKENPFLDTLKVEMEVTKKKKLIAGKDPSMVVSSSGEVLGTQLFAMAQKVDKEKFIKIYNKGIVEMFNLSMAGIKVFGYVSSVIKPNKANIIFDVDDCKEFTGYKSNKAINKGLAELLENQFIARTNKFYKYFINPTMFFNGDRVAFIKMYEVNEESNTESEEGPDLTKLID